MKWTIGLWAAMACCVCLTGFLDPAWAEDLAVEWVTVTPYQGQAGDTVNLEGRIANYGPGTALAVQYRWYLSTDEQITTDDMALGLESTLNNILYAGSAAIVFQPVTVPACPDPVAPSYFGLIVDPYEYAFDDNRGNNTGSATFTFVADPPHSFYDTVGDNTLDAVHLTAVIAGSNLEVALTFMQPPSSTISLLMGIDLDQDPRTTGDTTTLPGTEAISVQNVNRKEAA